MPSLLPPADPERRASAPSDVLDAPAPPYRPIAPLRWLYHRFFRHVRVDEQWTDVVQRASRRGVVVYVMRSISWLDFLCLDHLTHRLGLPRIRFVNDLGLWILEPFGRGERRLRLRRQIPEAKALEQVVRHHHGALLFLRRPPRLGRKAPRGEQLPEDLLQVLLRAQRAMERPILLVPQTFVWSQRAPQAAGSPVDRLLGPEEYPGRLRVLFQFLRNYRHARLRSGEPFDLKAFVEEHPDLTDTRLADKLRFALLRRLERERTLVLGPVRKPPSRIREEILRSPRIRAHLEQQAEASGRPLSEVRRQAARELRRLCADQRPEVIALLERLLTWVWHRIYDGLVVDREGLERLRAAARDAAIVLLPSHKSHVDYLVLSYVLYHHALAPPLIAAGDNLNFWPLGPVLRRAGAFFIRRSFKGRRLYAALVDAYVRRLLLEGYAIEFFLEGGRSRTGKLRPPKYGLLSMVVDAALMLRGRKVRFVPISIGYERIVEERAYVHELTGGEKRRESLGELLKTPRVLRSRYGRLYVQFGRILDLEETLRETFALAPEEPLPDRLSPAQRRRLVQRIAHEAMHEIGRVTVVTPAALAATALLTHRRRGLTEEQLLTRCEALLQVLRHTDAPLADALLGADGSLRPETLREALALFADGKLVHIHELDGERIVSVPEERRISLEYYQNTIVERFVPRALVAVPLRAAGGWLPEERLRRRAAFMADLFSHEFASLQARPLPALLEEALVEMARSEEVVLDEDGEIQSGRQADRLETWAEILLPFLEAYRIATRSALDLLGQEPMPRKDWIRATLRLGERAWLAGAVERRESIARPKLETALRVLQERKLVEPATGEGLRLPKGEAAREALIELEADLAALALA